jgi:hypothetical protein
MQSQPLASITNISANTDHVDARNFAVADRRPIAKDMAPRSVNERMRLAHEPASSPDRSYFRRGCMSGEGLHARGHLQATSGGC